MIAEQRSQGSKVQSPFELVEAIQRMKREKNVVFLAHYYQTPEIQELADFVGDSLALAQAADRSKADIILFAGVHFMAETAKILNPKRTVLLPDLNAGCSLAESAPPEKFRAFLDEHPDHVVVSYINCSAEVKAMSDIICTSSNAVRVVNSIPPGKPIIFAPDKHLGAYVQRMTGRELLLWDGVCEVHVDISANKLKLLLGKYPEAKLIAHPECPQEILDEADHVGSTSSLLSYVKDDPAQTFIVATEAGILHKMQQAVPHKKLIPAPAHANNTCACSECPYMKMNTLEKVYEALLNGSPEIVLEENVRQRAETALRRMMQLG
ncbi:MAG TPA: quinolinate synthase NadA [Flavobacteriales bacterium]|jgi:quinolinate synthase|nr:quinolinate synthase NadA [Flavobacteriales bacterium]MBK7111276.1 quinolinate synthase NadA [Flavobacteriales bacterium]MBK7618130.1 quinolinate synthase NadA [Flavobacteriales bacterium]MBP9178626.1 quinolinate synthase NadA [Flavobacteriales bacterium]HQY00640.1 quinolinate synthase NadA [Flavobacteriales bacterium]